MGFSVCSVCTVCSLHFLAQAYTNCAPGALVCSSRPVVFKSTGLAHCVHTCVLDATVYTISFIMSTLTFFSRQPPLHLAGGSRTGGGRSPTRAPSYFISSNCSLSLHCTYPEHSGPLGSKFCINTWAMIWSSDHPRDATKA